jgi:Zn-dependent protease
MIGLLYQGQYALFMLIVLALVISLSFHEFGHAAVAKLYGDDTAERAGRLTLNPLAHIDPMGLLMVVLVGFGYAKPVPTDPRNFRSRWAELWVSAAGPLMNLLVAVVALNFFTFALKMDWGYFTGQGPRLFFLYLARINLILMLFNLIPLGALDGHYILPYFLNRRWAAYYTYYNERYGNMALMGLVLLSVVGIPVFAFVWAISGALLPLIAFV